MNSQPSTKDVTTDAESQPSPKPPGLKKVPEPRLLEPTQPVTMQQPKLTSIRQDVRLTPKLPCNQPGCMLNTNQGGVQSPQSPMPNAALQQLNIQGQSLPAQQM